MISREAPAAYHVRGYLAAKVVKGETTISWVWDVFDRDEHRALRISGDETTKDGKGRSRDVWNVADDAMLRRIAHSSVEQLASFLTSAEVAPATSGEPRLAFLGTQDSSPEAAGIFRIVPSNADPVEAVQAPRCKQRKCRSAAAAAPQTGIESDRIGPRNDDPVGRRPLAAHRLFTLPEKASGQRFPTRIAAPFPPCYDHAAVALAR